MEIVEILYVVLIIFVIVVGSLLSVVLFRLSKVLGVAMEIIGYYHRVKQILMIYSEIPDIIKQKVKGFFSRK